MRSVAAGWALLTCVSAAWALSAGAPRGLPLIGRPLELAIPVRWERGEEAPCVRAEFQQGESPGGPLSWRIARTGETSGLLRLTSTLAVQEPMVSVQVALGCGEQLTRQYVMLAEPPNEARETQAEAAVAPELPVALAPLALAAAPKLGAAPLPAAAGGAPDKAAAPGRRTRHAATRAIAAGPGRAAPVAPPSKPAATATASTRPRLKLEPIDVEIDEAPILRLSNALTLPPAAPGGTAGDGAAARATFQALDTPPEQQGQANRAMQAELKAMRDLVQRYGAESRAATQRLDQVSGERDLVLRLLVGLVVLLGAGFAWLLWLRTRESALRQAWWQGERDEAPARPAAAVAPVIAPAAPVVVPVSVPAVAPPAPAAVTAASEDFIELPDFLLSPDHGRAPAVEELVAVLEQVEFFLAADQPDKAVHLLESQLQEPLGNSPVVWLELLDLCRRLGRREDYERLRIAFQKLFVAPQPSFDGATAPAGGLEAHAGVLARIASAWRSPQAREAIAESLFAEAKAGAVAFDLAAARELLLLHGIAGELQLACGDVALAREWRAGNEPFPDTIRAPLSADDGELALEPFLADIALDLPPSPRGSRA